jgi:hypothetical protein
MRKMKLLMLLLTPLLLATTCDDDPNYPSIGLQGEWQLVRISNGFSGASRDIEEGLISWTFAESYRSVYVSNDSEDENDTGLTSLNHQYSIHAIPDVCSQALIVEDRDFGCIEIIGDSLKISAAHVDGDTFTFIR